ncbi:MAG: hypothetical protein ABI625_10025 [bacterium]
MSLTDILLVGSITVVAAWWVVAPSRAQKWMRRAPAALIVLAALQIAIEGVYWQLFSGYVAIVVFGVLSLFRNTPRASGGLAPKSGRIAIGALALLVIAPWTLMPPVPELPKPYGPHAVGTQVFRWIDLARGEAATEDAKDSRNVIVQAWYPARPGTRGKHSAYIDGLGRLPAKISLFPGFLLESYGRVDTHGLTGAAVAADKPQWPVVVLSPGFGAPRAFYTSLAADLASRGFVVLAIDHPFEVAVTQLADGTIATQKNDFPGGDDAAGTAYMVDKLATRVADIRFALDQIARPDAVGSTLAGHLDLQHIAAIGHSFGGAAAATAMLKDPRITAAANIDGTLYGPVIAARLDRPFLLLESDHVETGHSARNIADNTTLLDNMTGPGWHFEIKRANHYSFTDAPLFFAPPARFALSLLIGGGRGPAETQRAAADIVEAFLSEPLTGKPANIAAAASRYTGIEGGPTKPRIASYR